MVRGERDLGPLTQRVYHRDDVYKLLWAQDRDFQDRYGLLTRLTREMAANLMERKFTDLYDLIESSGEGYKIVRFNTNFLPFCGGDFDYRFTEAFQEDNPDGELEVILMLIREITVRNPKTNFTIGLDIRRGREWNLFTRIELDHGKETPKKLAALKSQCEFKPKRFNEVSELDIRNSIALLNAIQYLAKGRGLSAG